MLTRALEHLNPKSAETAISQHIQICTDCSNAQLNVSSFKIIKKCRSDYETKIEEAILLKKLKPSLNNKLYATGCSFLLNVY